MYLRGDGQEWTEAVDILVSAAQTSLAIHSALIDSKGYLHLLWSDTGAIYHSMAHVSFAENAQSWTTTKLSSGHIPIGDLAIGKSGTLYCIIRADEFTLRFSVSEDGGAHWTESTLVASVSNPLAFAITDVGLVWSDGKTLQLTWSIGAAEVDWMYWSVWYARTTDGGQSWSVEQEIASPRFGGSDVAVDGNGGVHLVWGRNAGYADGRWHSYSTDQGLTWSKPGPLFQGISHASGATGGYGLVVDGTGVLHLANSFNQDGVPVAYYTYWNVDRWSTPEFVMGEGLHFATLALVRGNQLYYFGLSDPDHRIVYSRKTIAAPPIPLSPAPPPVSAALAPTVSSKDIYRDAPQPTSSATSSLPVDSGNATAPTQTHLYLSSQRIYILAMLPTGLFIGVFIVVHVWRRRHY